MWNVADNFEIYPALDVIVDIPVIWINHDLD